MNIIYSSSDYYSQPTGVSLVSLLENNKKVESINIYIIDSGIADKNKKNLMSICRDFSRSVEFIDSAVVFSAAEGNFGLKTLRGSLGTYARVFLNSFLPHLDRVILIDSDTLVLGELSALWNFELHDSVIGAVPDDVVAGKYSCHEDRDIIHQEKPYYNMGVVLVDFINWRKHGIDQLLSKSLSESYNYKIADQSIINKYLRPYITGIPLKYNFYTFYHNKVSHSYFQHILGRSYFNEEAFLSASDAPSIVHFIGHWFERPWFIGGRSPYKEVYMAYRDQTPWATEKLFERPANVKGKALLVDLFLKYFVQTLPAKLQLMFRYRILQQIKKLFRLSRSSL